MDQKFPPSMVLQPKSPLFHVRAFAEALHPASAAPKKFVVDAVVAKKLVVVAFVPVAFRNVKFWRVEEPATKNCPEL